MYAIHVYVCGTSTPRFRDGKQHSLSRWDMHFQATVSCMEVGSRLTQRQATTAPFRKHKRLNLA